MLFNDSIMNNVRYARISASDKEVYEACQAAAIHDKIMSFPDGMLTTSFVNRNLLTSRQAITPKSVIEECKLFSILREKTEC
jgi:ABC-type transport system involved in Fe-S cluster assembly fused permease/ATPase subunit